MPYIHITHAPGAGLTEYRAVVEALGPEPVTGNLLHIVGESDGVLHIVDVWDSSVSADRYAAERLFPAFEKAGVRLGPETRLEVFDTEIVQGTMD
ncbi:hypothetical protein [Nocardia xishanensis]